MSAHIYHNINSMFCISVLGRVLVCWVRVVGPRLGRVLGDHVGAQARGDDAAAPGSQWTGSRAARLTGATNNCIKTKIAETENLILFTSDSNRFLEQAGSISLQNWSDKSCL